MSNVVMEMVWRDFILFSAKDKRMVELYRKETGNSLFAETPIERTIDEATGALNDNLFSFARWVTEREWGMEHAPAAFIEECGRRDKAAVQTVSQGM
ncbi:hypothetical protein [Desulfovibrio sp. SGI.169]|uniref:hypothetical protein n=1 Tax=Desulfovibrio sp. SGI.169 TaxID=3420561 RepID=UPI003D08771C